MRGQHTSSNRDRICSGPGSRREFLKAGLLTLGGLTLGDVLRAREAAGNATVSTSVILLYLNGGPSHLETYDLKPEAPIEYRSVFRPIRTSVPGIDICEHFPLQARLAHRFALIRSLHHRMTSHSDGGIEMWTGKTPTRPDPTSTSVGEHPDLGAVASRMHGEHPEGLPRYVSVAGRMYMTRPTYLGLQHGPFITGNPAAVDFTPPNLRLNAGLMGRRLDDRRAMLRQFDTLRRGLDLSGQLEGTDHFRDRAFRLLTSQHVSQAFNLTCEPERLRDRYGRHLWGQSCLLARRLAEAGVSVITVSLNTPQVGPEWTNWDDHILNAMRPGHFAGYMERRLPYLDQCLSALVEDICARGLEQRILVVVMGEFGRTPRLSRNANGVGRDHWPDVFSALVAGGNLRLGQVVGASNSRGEFPSQRPTTPKDLLATVYQHLGIDPHHQFLDHTGRPVPILGEGRALAELV